MALTAQEKLLLMDVITSFQVGVERPELYECSDTELVDLAKLVITHVSEDIHVSDH
jgi:hypothetical protein